MIKPIKKTLSSIVTVARLTNVSNKKLRILISVFLSNIIVGLDILIIIFFTSFFSPSVVSLDIINRILDYKVLLPFFVILRFIFVIFDKLNIRNLQLSISENLKNFLIQDIYKKGNYSISDSTYYLTQLTDHISYFFGAVAIILSGVIQLILYLIYLIYTSLNTVLIFISIGIVFYIPTIYFLKQGRRQMDKNYFYGIEINEKTQNIIENIYLFKILNTFNSELNNFKNSTKEFSKSNIKNYFYGTLNSLAPNLLTTAALAVLLLLGNLAKQITLEFIGITLRFVQSLGNINNGLNMAINSHVHLEKIIQITKNNKNTTGEKFLNTDIQNAIEVKDVSFKYFGADDYLFKNLNISFEQGTHNLIIGPNGSGKSTFLGIISGVLDPDYGTVTLNSENLGYVGVKPLIIDNTLRENLIYGNKQNISDSLLIETVKKFKLFNEDYNIDLDKIISNSTLSSGQFQKISFIRVFLSDTKILILDESTSNLDEDSKDLIFKILNEKDITIVNSTHNINEFNFDKIYKINIKNNVRTLEQL